MESPGAQAEDPAETRVASLASKSVGVKSAPPAPDGLLLIENDDKEERIKQRRERILHREENKTTQQGTESEEESEITKKGHGQRQKTESLALADRKKLSTTSYVTSVRLESDQREIARRGDEEKRKALRQKRLQDEETLSNKRNAAVELRWAELLQQSMPQELYQEIVSQKAACSLIIASKDKVINNFHDQLKLKDEEYVKALKQQAKDVETLITRMGEQFKQMYDEYESELERIEAAFLKEREELLQSNRSEVDSLFEKRRQLEASYVEKRQNREEKFHREIDSLRVHDAEEYSKLKIKLENEIQKLEQQLEEMRVTYQLNTEKLEYNYRVLTERDMENNATLAQQKRKLNRLKEILAQLKQKYMATDTRDRQKNHELTEEYRRITKQYKDMQVKFHHFELSDSKKFVEVWQMHEKEVIDYIHKLLQADKVIHSQQLGIQWAAPSQSLAEFLSQRKAGELSAPSKTPELDLVSLTEGSGSGKAGRSGAEENAIPVAKVKAMLELLASEAGFLLEKETREALQSLPKEQAMLAQAEAMLKTLGVKNEADLRKLTSYFFRTVSEEEMDNNNFDGDITALSKRIRPDDVISAIKTFVEEQRENNTSSLTAQGVSIGHDEIQEMEKRREKARQREKEFWHIMTNIISEKSVRVWGALEKGLIKYNEVLDSRSKIIDEVMSLERENRELRNMLNQHLLSPVNDDLIIPPSQTLHMDQPPSSNPVKSSKGSRK